MTSDNSTESSSWQAWTVLLFMFEFNITCLYSVDNNLSQVLSCSQCTLPDLWKPLENLFIFHLDFVHVSMSMDSSYYIIPRPCIFEQGSLAVHWRPISLEAPQAPLLSLSGPNGYHCCSFTLRCWSATRHWAGQHYESPSWRWWLQHR